MRDEHRAPSARVAVITVHGIADQQPGQTVRELAGLLCHGHVGAPRYVDGELHQVIVPVSRLPSLREARTLTPAPTEEVEGAQGLSVVPGRASDFYVAQKAAGATAKTVSAASDDLGLALTDHLLAQYRPAERDSLYESTRISLRRAADDTEVDLYELYWADYSRLQPGGVRALSASYQLFFHLNTLARDVVDQIALAAGGGRALRLLQWLHAWSAWLLKGPAALLQLAMLLTVAFGVTAFVPLSEYRFVLGLGGSVAALILALCAWLAWNAGGTARTPVAGACVAGSLTCLGLAVATLADLASDVTLFLVAAAVLVLVAGTLLIRRYARTVRDVQAVGYVILCATVALLLVNSRRAFAFASTPFEWLITTALHTGEFLLAALLLVWAVLVTVQMAALLLGFAQGRGATPDVAASLMTARIGLTISTALFVMLSLVLWSVIGYLAGLALNDLPYTPLLLGEGYRSAAIFFEAQVQDVGALFTPLMALAGAIGAATVVALAPGLREEIVPTAAPPAGAAARLGRWWSAARRKLGGLFGTGVPLLAIGSGAIYLLFVLEKLGGVGMLLALLGSGTSGAVLVEIGKWLAGGALTITALGARFTETFGKLRVALDAVLDVDNYFRDPHDHRPPRARIFSRYAALLDYVRRRSYHRVVIVAHSQGTVISADLLHYLHRTARLRSLTGALPLALVTVGSPLRDLYAARFPLLYRWMGAAPSSFDAAGPAAAQLGLWQWVNAYRSGDYVGRALWTPAGADAEFRVADIDAQGQVSAARADDRVEFCLGTGAHTHYFANDANALAAEVDRLITTPLPARA